MPASAWRRQPSARIARATGVELVVAHPSRPVAFGGALELAVGADAGEAEDRGTGHGSTVRTARSDREGTVRADLDQYRSPGQRALPRSVLRYSQCRCRPRDRRRPPLPAARRRPRGADRGRHLSARRPGPVGAPAARAAPGQRHDGPGGAAGCSRTAAGSAAGPARATSSSARRARGGPQPEPGPPTLRARRRRRLAVGDAEPRHREPAAPDARRRGPGPRADADHRAQPADEPGAAATAAESHSYDAPPGQPGPATGGRPARAPRRARRYHPDEVVVTSGAKEAVYLSIRAVTRPGDTVAIESPPTTRCSRCWPRSTAGGRDRRATRATGLDLDALAGCSTGTTSPRWRWCRTSPTRPAPA